MIWQIHYTMCFCLDLCMFYSSHIVYGTYLHNAFFCSSIMFHSKTTLSKWTWTALYFSINPIHPGRDDTTWYHHDLDGHKDGIFTEKYRAVLVHFGKVVLLCLYCKRFWVIRLSRERSNNIDYRHSYSD